MNHDPYQWGRPDDRTYGPYNQQIANAKITENVDSFKSFPKMNTQNPIITGTSVVSLKFKDGILMAADNLGSYGSLLRFSNIERLIEVGEDTIVGISGDISDMQYIERILEQIETEEQIYDSDGGHTLRAPHIHEYLTKLMYQRRSKMNPLWNSVIVGGFNDDGSPFLKYVDLLGVSFGSSTLATGFGSYLAIPLLRKLIPNDSDYENVTEEQARKVMFDCMKVLFYRDARSMDKFSLVTIKKGQPLKHEKNLALEEQSWRFAENIRGYGSSQL